MKQTAFYQATLGRSNVVLTRVLEFFFSITSHSRLVLEVWVRKNFGSGYMTLSSVITVGTGLLIFPYFLSTSFGRFEWFEFFQRFTTWYAYAFAFIYKGWKHCRENRLSPGEFDFDKFSKFSGDKDLRFYQLDKYGLNVNPRLIATFYEPFLFFVIGLLMMLIGQPIGYLFCACSIIYSLGYSGAFHIGDMYLQEIIDKMILSKEISETCMKGKTPRAHRGFENFAMPKNPDELKQMASFVTSQNEFAEVR